MKAIVTILIFFNSVFVTGQIVLKGKVKTYEDNLEMPFSLLCLDTIDTFSGFSTHTPIDSTKTDLNGNFILSSDYQGEINLIVTYMGYVPLTIKKIVRNDCMNEIDLGNIYLPFRGQWVEGYKPTDGETKKEARRSHREWRKSNDSIPINWMGYSPDFFEPYRGMDTIYLKYPSSGIKKEFSIKDESLIIDFKEFKKE